jgi:hypothetical protein
MKYKIENFVQSLAYQRLELVYYYSGYVYFSISFTKG